VGNIARPQIQVLCLDSRVSLHLEGKPAAECSGTRRLLVRVPLVMSLLCIAPHTIITGPCGSASGNGFSGLCLVVFRRRRDGLSSGGIFASR
jgi:hypothetical protein